MSKMALGTALSRLSTLRRLLVSAKCASSPMENLCARFVRCVALHSFYRHNSHYECCVEKEIFEFIPIQNEKLLDFEKGTEERLQVKLALSDMLNSVENIPIVVNGKEINEKCNLTQILPFDQHHPIASYAHADRLIIDDAIETATEAQKEWNNVRLSERMTIWEYAAELISTEYRFKIIAAIMLGQGKTLRQADMDVAELVDFMRINPIFLRDLANYEPVNNSSNCHNHMILRGLTGFVAAITPFNYTSIAGNLAYTPALMGNAVLWKPSDSAILSNWFVFQAMRKAGVPDGVVNFVPASPTVFARAVTQSRNLAAIHFTGTKGVLKVLWRMVAEQINIYHNYPRLIGESGGKNFHFVHPSADAEAVVACTIRAAFEYAGQKCSSCSMLYVPKSLWKSEIMKPLLSITRSLFVSESTYCDCFYSAVINEAAFNHIFSYLQYIHNNSNCKLLLGGTGSKKKGYYIRPTIVLVKDLNDFLCKEELMAPILCVHVYEDDQLEQTMEKVAEINKGLTGSVFASDSRFIKKACQAFRSNVGSLIINDKCTGSKAGQQPFGGGAISGTSEKMGSPQYLLRWTSPQIVKECFVPHVNVFYPYMEVD